MYISRYFIKRVKKKKKKRNYYVLLSLLDKSIFLLISKNIII